ncbi:MAG: hypothetical protein F6K56_08105 [Moorea sp. SIO3G5]|nr:hypothetical protein [Moorena sp. SIO3G5]
MSGDIICIKHCPPYMNYGHATLPTLHQLKSIWGYTIPSYLFPVPCSLFPKI